MQRKNLLTWNQGTRKFLRQLQERFESQNNELEYLKIAHCLDRLDISRMLLAQPTNDEENGLLEDDYADMDKIKTCFRNAISGDDILMSYARLGLDQILSVSLPRAPPPLSGSAGS